MLQRKLAGFIKNKSKGLFYMDKIKKIEKIEKYQEEVKELFKEFSNDELYDTWADTFDIESVDERQVVVTYHGTDDIKKFKKECKDTLVSCIDSIIGEGKKIRIFKKSIYNRLSPNIKKNIKAFKFFAIGMVFVCIATAMVVIMCNYIGNRSFRATRIPGMHSVGY